MANPWKYYDNGDWANLQNLTISQIASPEPIFPPTSYVCNKIGSYDFLLLTPKVKPLSVGDSSIAFKIAIKNPRYLPWPEYNHIDIRSKPYVGFIVLFREHCGKKFLKGLSKINGAWDLDIVKKLPEEYIIQYLTLGHGKSRLVIQYRLETNSTEIKNLKREELHVVFRSTESKLNFEDITSCVENSQIGVMNYPKTGGNDDYTNCIFDDEKRAKRIQRKRWRTTTSVGKRF